MTKEDFKNFCRNEFNIKQFSTPECFKPMENVFGVRGRTFVNWIQKDNVRPYFDASVKMYFENKKLSGELKLIYKKLISS